MITGKEKPHRHGRKGARDPGGRGKPRPPADPPVRHQLLACLCRSGPGEYHSTTQVENEAEKGLVDWSKEEKIHEPSELHPETPPS